MDAKHAYLIMAHNDFTILEKQIKLLDDVRNDLYIHIDKKVADFDFEYFQKCVTKSPIFFIDRLDVRWGDFSQTQCEMELLKAAVVGNYQYYHLLSGVDLPLKSNDEIHMFFHAHQGKEFVHFVSAEVPKKIKNRVLQYHFMHSGNILRYIGYLCEKIETVTKHSRKWDSDMAIQYGANWFSITHALAEYVISMETWIYRYFRHTSCADEIFLQTIVYNSDFFQKLYYDNMDDNYVACMRCIDWTRGSPYVFRDEDFNMLIHSGRLFARKFSTAVDDRIVARIYEYIAAENRKNNHQADSGFTSDFSSSILAD